MHGLRILYDELPTAFLDISHRDIKKVFDTPTLIHLSGEAPSAVFVSILIHGNEYSGLEIMQEILQKYKTSNGYKLPRSIWLFVGNVDAAEFGLRLLDAQVDFNRAWPGAADVNNDTSKLMQHVMDTITKTELFAAVDLHNNTGQNPPYGCISQVNEQNKYLCTLFNHIAMVFKTPKGVSTMAFDDICPAITLECSTPGNVPAKEKACELVDALLHMDHFPEKPVPEQDLQLVQNSATVKVNENVTFSFEDNLHIPSEMDVIVLNNFDHHNFTILREGEVFAHTKVAKPFIVTSHEGKDITETIIDNNNGAVSLKKALMPAMISIDKKIVLQDCLCYLLEDY